jgi:hypothetical protein
MTLVFCILLLLIGLGINRFCGQYLLHYLLLWFCFAPVLFNLIYTIEVEDYYKILTWAIYLSYAIALLDVVRFGINDHWLGILILCIVGLVVYYVSLSFFRGTSIIDSLKYITSNLGFIISLFFIYNKGCEIDSLIRLIRKIVVFELILAFLQPYADLFNFHAALNGDDVMTAMVNGTFIRNNVFIEFLTPLVMLLVYFDYKQTQRILPQTVIIVLLLLYETYNSGVRTALVAVIPVIVYVFYCILGYRIRTKKGRFLAMIFFVFCFYTVYSFVQSLAEETGITYTDHAKDSSERQAVLLSMLNDADFAEEQTTLGLSFVVLASFSENPLLGPGKLFQGNGYGDFINMNEGNVTDATLAIFLCETGVVGFLLLLFIYYVILNKIGLSHPFPKLVFIYLFIVTIADPGIFFMGNILLLFISITLVNANLEVEEDTGEYAYSEEIKKLE